MPRRAFSRRTFLGTVGIASAGALLAACTSPAAPTPAPAATTAPAAGGAPAPAATTAPAATSAPAAAATKPAAAATTAPAAATKPAAAAAPAAQAPATGGNLPEVITDPAKMPKQFKEAPMLADLVKAGKLPPVEKRLPEEPLVLKPTDAIGQYGGNWRMAFTGPADTQNMERHMHDHLIYWDPKVEKVVPHIAKGWDVQDGGKTILIHLRKGHKWSDGEPFTADDIMFWYEDLYLNEDLNPSKAAFMAIGGKQGTVSKVDETTVAFKFDQPYYMFLELIASLGVAGHMTNGRNAMGLWAPKHYMKQFHPKYAQGGKDALEKMAKDQKFDNWAALFKFKNDVSRNVDCPTTAPWKMVSPVTGPQAVYERNPYYFEVDTDGNQLPYIDKITWTLAENLEVANLRAIAGEYDLQVRHMDIAKLPAFKDNEAKGNYKIGFWKWLHGADAGFFVNQNYDADPEVAKWLRSKEFRQALSLGIDRNQLNEVFWLGQGEPGNAAPAETTPFSPGPGSRKTWGTFDAKKANDMLDALGLKKGPDGVRQRSDGKGALILEVTTVGAAFVNWTGISEMVAQHWLKNLGIKANVQEIERSLMVRRLANNELQIRVWSNDGSDNPFTYPDHILPYNNGSGWGPKYGDWYQSGGKIGVKPEGDAAKMLELFDQAKGVPAQERVAIGKQIEQLYIDNDWVIGTVGVSPALLGIVVKKNNFMNVPASVTGSTPGQTPGNARPEQFYFKT
ncbi:MAG TPA: ABC transporter substrate-binding protein [Chloroflexota bacterium]|nr:ABC transporter substrate-binding protein [Chloroflexota bacterium]